VSDADPIAAAAGELLAPLSVALEGPDELASLLESLGVTVELEDDAASAVADVLGVGTAAADLAEALGRLESDPAAAADVITAAAAVWTGIDELRSVGASAIAGLPAPLDTTSTWSELVDRLPGQLVATWLREHAPAAQSALELVGVFTREPDEGSLALPAYRTDWSALGRLVDDPLGAGAARLGWGQDFDAATAMILGAQAAGTFVTARWEAPPPEIVDLLFGGVPPGIDEAQSLRMPFGSRRSADGRRLGDASLVLTPVPGDDAGTVTGIHVALTGWGSPADLDLGSGWSLTTRGLPGDGSLVGGRVTPDGAALDASAGTDDLGVTLGATPPVPWRILGAADATRVELAGAALALDLLTVTPPDIVVRAELTGLRAVLDPGALGGLLAAFVPGGLDIAADLSFALSSRDGLRANGLPGFTIPLFDHLALGPVTLHDIVVELAPATGGLSVAGIAGIDLAIGPFAATVKGSGLRTTIAAPGTGGNLGPVDLALAGIVPTAVGLSLDAGPVTAAGVLIYDPSADTYGGNVTVDALAVGISAFGIVTAHSADDWSLLFALFIDVPSVPLGFGFTLNGVGGLAAVNRTLDADALGAVVRSGGLDAVLFPDDPVGDAQLTIDSLQSMFPPSEGRFVFGPVAKVGWGTPTLIDAELGIVISLPDPITIAVLGSVVSVLPTEDHDLVGLHLDVAGVVDFGAATLAIDAGLHDSHVVSFALSGDMALRASFGDPPTFLMALGGFHPGFEAPAGFPALERLSLGVSSPPVLEVYFGCYFALTSNTVQFGAEFELWAEVAGFGIEGGTEFDALVHFSPFAVSTRLGYYVAVTAANIDLVGVWLDASVEGPNPWYVVGTARFKILGLEDEVRIDEQIGTPQPEPPLPAADLFDALTTVLAADDAWSAVASPSPGVLLAAGDAVDGELVAMPDGTVSVSQRVVPLDVSLDKAGDAPLGAYDVFSVETAGASLTSSGVVYDWFAPGYFFELGPTEQLSSPSFELLESGIEFGGGGVLGGQARTGTLEYEQILRDPSLGEDRVDDGSIDLADDPRDELRAATATARRPAGFAVAADDEPGRLAAPQWAVADRYTGAVLTTTTSWSGAHQSDEARRPATTVMPGWEAAA
jgi:hypothetical protein